MVKIMSNEMTKEARAAFVESVKMVRRMGIPIIWDENPNPNSIRIRRYTVIVIKPCRLRAHADGHIVEIVNNIAKAKVNALTKEKHELGLRVKVTEELSVTYDGTVIIFHGHKEIPEDRIPDGIPCVLTEKQVEDKRRKQASKLRSKVQKVVEHKWEGYQPGSAMVKEVVEKFGYSVMFGRRRTPIFKGIKQEATQFIVDLVNQGENLHSFKMISHETGQILSW